MMLAVKERKKEEEPLKQQEKTAKLVKKKAARPSGRKARSLGQLVAPQDRAQRERPGLLLFTLIFIYKNLYILGILLLRQLLRWRRRAARLLLRTKGRLFALQHRLAGLLGRAWRSVVTKFRTPIQRIRETYRNQLPAIRAQRLEGGRSITPFLPVLEMVWRLVLKAAVTLFNYAAPVAAAVFLLVYVQEFLSTPVALKLEYEGDVLGYITSEAVFEDAAQIVRERTLNQDEQLIAISVPSFELVEPESDGYLDTETIADMIISRSDADVETAYGLYVAGRLVGAVKDKDAVLDEMDAMKAEGTTGKPGEVVQFGKKIRLAEGLYPSGSVIGAQQVASMLRRNEEESDYYEVQEGDTPWEIAEKLGMSYSDLLDLNPDIEDSLWPGDELLTKVERQFLPVQSVYVTTYEEEIAYETEVIENSTYAIGYENVMVEGVNGMCRVVAEVTEVNGVKVAETVIDRSEILVEPINKRVVKGINDARVASSPDDATGTDMSPSGQSGSGIRFIWPTVSGTRATTYSGHTGNGVDIAYTGGGVPVYAAASGQVTQVVNGYTGYGHYIIITHEGGYQTLYAHNSANHVRVGEYVEQGQVIGTMGRTGWATGNHVHFEVRYNGRYQNPTQYIGYAH